MVLNKHFLTISLVSFIVSAPSKADNKLEVTPNICIKQKTQPSCTIISEIKLQQPEPVPVCFTAKYVKHKRCFEPKEKIEYKTEFTTDASFLLQVTDKVIKQPVAERNIRVLRYDPESTKVRRRFGWGL